MNIVYKKIITESEIKICSKCGARLRTDYKPKYPYNCDCGIWGVKTVKKEIEFYLYKKFKKNYGKKEIKF